MNYILTKEIVDQYLQECSIAKKLNAHTLKAYQIDVYKRQLERCVQSVLNQTNTNYEIILVNDGSTDFSFHICLDFAVKYKNIKIIQQRNKGLSAARNIGILACLLYTSWD